MKRPGNESKQTQVQREARNGGARHVDSLTLERVMRRAVREALLVHKKLGQPIAIWRDGRVVEVSPARISFDN